mmetsp:Transcript_41054/g.113071  ORF Transcript_41054/g.113071 Transcript_41054/m.113071 type:complete len:286 (+) Transcript_41054:69-926(+)
MEQKAPRMPMVKSKPEVDTATSLQDEVTRSPSRDLDCGRRLRRRWRGRWSKRLRRAGRVLPRLCGSRTGGLRCRLALMALRVLVYLRQLLLQRLVLLGVDAIGTLQHLRLICRSAVGRIGPKAPQEAAASRCGGLLPLPWPRPRPDVALALEDLRRRPEASDMHWPVGYPPFGIAAEGVEVLRRAPTRLNPELDVLLGDERLHVRRVGLEHVAPGYEDPLAHMARVLAGRAGGALAERLGMHAALPDSDVVLAERRLDKAHCLWGSGIRQGRRCWTEAAWRHWNR